MHVIMFWVAPPTFEHTAGENGPVVVPLASVLWQVATPPSVTQVVSVPSCFWVVQVVTSDALVTHVVDWPLFGSVADVDETGSDPAGNVVVQFMAP
jgi:hypothetical protein